MNRRNLLVVLGACGGLLLAGPASAAPPKVEVFISSATGVLKIKKDQTNLKLLLNQKKVAFVEYDVASDVAKRELLKKVTGKTDLPQLVVNGVGVGNFDEVLALEEAGKLDAKLQGK